MRIVLLALFGFWFSAGAAAAAQAGGPYALALAGVVAEHDPLLGARERYAVAALFAGHERVFYPARAHIVVRAVSVVCRVSNVQITARSCQMTFGHHVASLSGASANAVFATLAAAGVPGDGAAGSIFEAVHGLVCTLSPSVIKQNAGGGATCVFSPGP